MKIIQHFLKNSLRNFNYIVYSELTSEAIFFDPSDLAATLQLAKDHGVTPKYLLLTHHHHDHISDVKEFLNLPQTQELVLVHNETWNLSETEKIKCIYTPGHVADHKCYILLENDQVVGLISGDTVFNAGVGNCKNGGNVEDLYKTIKYEILQLPDQTKLYPSHDYFLTNLKFAKTIDEKNDVIDQYIQMRESMNLDEEFLVSTLAEEKKYNPFFRAFDKKFQVAHQMDERELFTSIRLKRDRW